MEYSTRVSNIFISHRDPSYAFSHQINAVGSKNKSGKSTSFIGIRSENGFLIQISFVSQSSYLLLLSLSLLLLNE